MATVGGASTRFCTYQDLVIRSVPSEVGIFRRCDANNDAKNDIADAVWIIMELFLGEVSTRCREAADCNDDGRYDISDALHAIEHQFRGGAPPPPPFPGCGTDPDSTPESCPPDAVTACS